jgi:hypothetical protein
MCAATFAACGEAGDERVARADSVAAAIGSLPVGDSGAPKLLPTDEADASFAAFRRELLAALERRDTAFLYSILSPSIKNSFGGVDSVSGFRRVWDMEQPDSSRVWRTLARALSMGGLMRGENFVAPYVFAAWPAGIDAFEHVAITGENVPAHAAADTASAMVARLTYSILPLREAIDFDDPAAMAQLTLPDGRTVWVRSTDIYSPVYWRAIFEKQNDRWIMIVLIAGD